MRPDGPPPPPPAPPDRRRQRAGERHARPDVRLLVPRDDGVQHPQADHALAVHLQLGADNIPYIPLVAAVAIGVIMQGYSRAAGLMPPRWVIPIAQGAMAGLLVMFWFLFQTGHWMVAAGFYLFGLIMGILLISQFWTLANEIYDARQAKRLFGFIGAGASLGGIVGSSLLTFVDQDVRHQQPAARERRRCSASPRCSSSSVEARSPVQLAGIATAGEEKGVGGSEALRMLRESKHLQVIALVIAFGAIGAYLIEQQLNMAAEAFKGRGDVDSLTAFLGTVQLYTSIAGFLIQVLLTSRIHRQLGHRLRAADPAGQPGHERRDHAGERGAVGAGAGARPRHVAALHGRQDDPRDPVPAAARRPQAPGEAVRRRHRRPHGQGRRRPAGARAHRAVGPEPRTGSASATPASSSAACGSSPPSGPSTATSAPSARDSSAATSSPTRCGCRPPTRRRSRRWSPSWPIPTRRASATPSTCSSRSTSAT